MSDTAIADHYSQPELLTAIERAIGELGKTTETVTAADLAPADEFHTGGRPATERLLDQLELSPTDHLLDVGCGIGGPSRTAAARVDRVTGIDLTQAYVETGIGINRWLDLTDRIDLQVGSALDMPFEDERFDGGYMIHVGMNIEDKERLLQQIARVLRPGAPFAIYDVMAGNDEDLEFPMPWASEASTSHVVQPERYRQAAIAAGLEVVAENDRLEEAKQFLARVAGGQTAPSPLGLHLVMGPTVGDKVKNMVGNFQAGRIRPVELILRRPAVT